MRPGFLLGLFVFVTLAVLALTFIPRKSVVTVTVEPSPLPVVETAPAQVESIMDGPAALPQAPPSGAGQPLAKASPTPELSAEAREEQREALVAARIAELRDLSTRTDHASLETLLAELRNPDQEIRQATLDIISQSGNRAAIPGLLDAAAQIEDAGEKQAIAEAIEFLRLPTLTEIMNLKKPGTNN